MKNIISMGISIIILGVIFSCSTQEYPHLSQIGPKVYFNEKGNTTVTWLQQNDTSKNYQLYAATQNDGLLIDPNQSENLMANKSLLNITDKIEAVVYLDQSIRLLTLKVVSFDQVTWYSRIEDSEEITAFISYMNKDKLTFKKIPSNISKQGNFSPFAITRSDDSKITMAWIDEQQRVNIQQLMNDEWQEKIIIDYYKNVGHLDFSINNHGDGILLVIGNIASESNEIPSIYLSYLRDNTWHHPSTTETTQLLQKPLYGVPEIVIDQEGNSLVTWLQSIANQEEIESLRKSGKKIDFELVVKYFTPTLQPSLTASYLVNIQNEWYRFYNEQPTQNGLYRFFDEQKLITLDINESGEAIVLWGERDGISMLRFSQREWLVPEIIYHYSKSYDYYTIRGTPTIDAKMSRTGEVVIFMVVNDCQNTNAQNCSRALMKSHPLTGDWNNAFEHVFANEVHAFNFDFAINPLGDVSLVWSKTFPTFPKNKQALYLATRKNGQWTFPKSNEDYLKISNESN